MLHRFATGGMADLSGTVAIYGGNGATQVMMSLSIVLGVLGVIVKMHMCFSYEEGGGKEREQIFVARIGCLL